MARISRYFEVTRDESAPRAAARFDRRRRTHPAAAHATRARRFPKTSASLSGSTPASCRPMLGRNIEQQLERGPTWPSRRSSTPIAKYTYLRGLQERNEILYYALIERHLREMLPIIYTPTVGDAVIHASSRSYRGARGLSLSPRNIPRAAQGHAKLHVRRRPHRRRRHGLVGHPRDRRPGLGRALDRHRQARALHGRRRREPVPLDAGGARRRHRPAGPARQPDVPRPPAEAPARRRVPGADRPGGRRDPRSLAARGHPVGGPLEGHGVRRARAVSQARPVVQRRYPGDGRRGARGPGRRVRASRTEGARRGRRRVRRRRGRRRRRVGRAAGHGPRRPRL